MKSIKIRLGVTGFVTAIAIALALVASTVYGYVENIIKLTNISYTGHEGEFIVRVAGIFLAGIGAIAGYF